jgi:LCP family protein required for cell wall assembly
MGRYQDAGSAGRRRRFGGRRPPLSPRAKAARWVAVIVAGALVGGVLTAYLNERAFWDSINRIAVTGLGHRPPKYTNALNLLVFGSDSRSGLTTQEEIKLHVGRNQGETNTDTIMIVHISPGHHRVTVINIPRDTMVPYYSCPAGDANGQSWPGQQASTTSFERINAVYAAGGVSCLWKTVEQQTHIHIDHFIELGFGGFVKVINDLGGVRVCVPFNIDDPVSGLRLTRGYHRIGGTMALKFWRTREAIGTGSDLQRIQRDQFMLAQVLKGVLHSGILSSPTKLLSVIRDAASSMTTDTGLTQSDMLQIASSFRGISTKDVRFITAPNTPYPADPNEVEFAQPQASRLFSAIAHDVRLPKGLRGHQPARHKGSGGAPVLDAKPSAVRVEVLNGSGVAGIAGQVASALSARGFDVVGTSDATTVTGAADFSYPNSVIKYSSSSEAGAVATLRRQLSSVAVQRDPSLAPGTIDLIVGSNFTSLAPQASTSPSASATPSASSLSKRNYGGISGNARACSDASAFSGPNSP